MIEETKELTAALRVVQAAGYVVYNPGAYRTLSYGTSEDTRMLAAYNKDTGFTDYLRKRHARGIADELLKSGYLVFQAVMPTEEDVLDFGMTIRTQLRTTFRFFAAQDREFKRS